jgi:hypothetical protein
MIDKLTHVEGKIVVKIDMDGKNTHKFEDGTIIRRERKYDCFDQKFTKPVNAIVISADNIPEGAEVLIHHNSTHDNNIINNYQPLSGNIIASDIKYLSIREDEAFAWYDEVNKCWTPLKGFDFALQVFIPYKGVIQNVEPTLVKNALFVTTGQYKDNVCMTLQASNYKIIFQDRNGREGNLIRFRSEEDLATQREAEVILLHHEYTKKVLNGEYLIGIDKSDAKQIKEYIHERVH